MSQPGAGRAGQAETSAGTVWDRQADGYHRALPRPASWQDAAGRWLPTNAGSALWSVRDVTHMFTAWTGFAVFLAYTATLLTWGFAAFARRNT
jgi:hypothetical protein